jgi:hypothetical protein
MGLVFLGIAAAIWLLFSRSIGPDQVTTYGLVPSGSDVEVQDWIFTTLPMLNILAFACTLAGGYQLAQNRIGTSASVQIIQEAQSLIK